MHIQSGWSVGSHHSILLFVYSSLPSFDFHPTLCFLLLPINFPHYHSFVQSLQIGLHFLSDDHIDLRFLQCLDDDLIGGFPGDFFWFLHDRLTNELSVGKGLVVTRRMQHFAFGKDCVGDDLSAGRLALLVGNPFQPFF